MGGTDMMGAAEHLIGVEPRNATLPARVSDSAAAPGLYWRWEHDEAARYYEVRLSQDLWGDWCVQRIWGGIGSPMGGGQAEHAPSIDAALALLPAIAQRRAQRGYQLVAHR